jgi:hypothetical protein
MVVGTTGDLEEALDGAFTPKLVNQLQAEPALSFDDALRRMTEEALVWFGDPSRGMQHPTILEYGRTAGRSSAGGGASGAGAKPNQKRAVLVANESYRYANPLGTPVWEANDMQGQLAARGYDAEVHENQTADEMGGLWNGMVGAAKAGDDVVAYFSGHGEPEGLLGIEHRQDEPDLFSNAQVSGVVNSATDRGAHIRFVMDSCFSGAVVQSVRSERQNELAKTLSTGSVADKLRLSALEGLRQAKQRMIALVKGGEELAHQATAARTARRAAGPSGAQPGQQSAAGTRDFGATRDAAMDPDYKSAYQEALDRLWAACEPALMLAKMIAKRSDPAPPIADYAKLGAQLNYLDDLWNAVTAPEPAAAADSAASASATADTGPVTAASSAA